MTVTAPGDERRRGSPRLMLIIGSLQGGGAERQLSDIANYWASTGAEITLATWSGKEVKDFYPLTRGVTRQWLDVEAPSWTPFAPFATNLRRVWKLRRVLRTLRPETILSFIDVSNVLTLFAARGLNVRVVIAERTHPAINRNLSGPWKMLRRIYYRRADAVVAQTKDAGEWLERNCRTRVTIIPNSLRNLPLIQCEREPTIIAVGRLSEEKGFDILLASFASIAHAYPMWRVCIIGEGSERKALERLRNDLGLTGRVDFVGQVNDVELWMARAGLLVHPSRREGFPNVVLEAMGMGLAVICANCRAGPSELIEDGVNGRLVPVDDAGELTQAMADLMANPELRSRLGREACKVRERFSAQRIMLRWEECLLPLRVEDRTRLEAGSK